MGNSSPQLLTSLPITSEWKQIESTGSHRLFLNSTTNQLAQQHMILVDNTAKLDQELMIYNYRKNQKLNLIKVYGVQTPSNTTACCGGTRPVRVLVEHIPKRLSDIQSYTFPQALYIFNEVLSACNAIVTKLGPIVFQDTMFAVTDEGIVKLWINPNFQVNQPSHVHLLKKSSRENQREMVLSLIKVVESHLIGGRFPEQFIGPIQSFLSLNFISFQGYVEKYADSFRVVIPDRLSTGVRGRQEVIYKIQKVQNQNHDHQVFGWRSVGQSVQYPLQPPLFLYNDHPNLQQHSIIRHSEPVHYMQHHLPIQNVVTKVESYQPQQPQIVNQIPPSSIFPRYPIHPAPSHHFTSTQISRKPIEMGSLLTADRTLSYVDNRNSLSYTNSVHGPIITSQIANIPQQQHILIQESNSHHNGSPQLLNANQIRTSSDIIYPPRQIIPTNHLLEVRQPLPPIQQPPHHHQPTLIHTQSQYQPKVYQTRTSLPTPVSLLPVQITRTDPHSLPIIHRQTHEQHLDYITPIKQIQKQQDMYMTTTTYKNHPKFKFQYRTIHPESVHLIADETKRPEVKRVKLEKGEIVNQVKVDKNQFQ